MGELKLEIIGEIQATSYFDVMKIGSTRPFIVNCGGSAYVSKAFDEVTENKHLINEFVCYHIAKLLDLPIPEANLIIIDDSFIESVPELRARDIRSKVLFGSKLVERAQSNVTPPFLERIKNKEDIPSILLFDQIVYNNDRANNDGNLLIDLKSNMLVALDHTHVFKDGLIWTEHSLPKINDEKGYLIDNFHGKYYKMLQRYVTGHNPFNKVKHTLTLIREENISLIVDSIPLEWGITDNEKLELKRFLWHRISNVDEIFKRIKQECPQWKGVI